MAHSSLARRKASKGLDLDITVNLRDSDTGSMTERTVSD